MPEKKFSLLIVDESYEVRECLGNLFRGANFEVSLAENRGCALDALPAHEGGWPDAIIVGQLPRGAPDSFFADLERHRPRMRERVPMIVFPSFPVAFETEEAAKPVQACRLSTVSNLVSVVRGLAEKRAPAS
jgi:hypothetical protein